MRISFLNNPIIKFECWFENSIVEPISRNKVQIWNINNYKHDVVIDGYMGSDDTTFYFLNSLGRWFLEHKNVDINVVTHLYYDEEETLYYINSLQWENL